MQQGMGVTHIADADAAIDSKRLRQFLVKACKMAAACLVAKLCDSNDVLICRKDTKGSCTAYYLITKHES